MKVTLTHKPEEHELLLLKHCIWIKTGKKDTMKKLKRCGRCARG